MKSVIPFITIIAIIVQTTALAQAPLVKMWDKRFGGTGDDKLTAFHQTLDGGYILAGESNSPISGDKTEPYWGQTDYWVVKIDSLGNKQWDKRFGGMVDDILTSIQQTSDKGYMLGGSSNSPVSGDKTQANWDTTWSGRDYWIVKIDSAGNKQWDRRFGGISWDYLQVVQQTTDNGYILGGYSLGSGISGDRTQNLWTGNDYWIVKIDSIGNKQWDKRFGGTYNDFLTSLEQTSDGGYILGGRSNSAMNGDKTQDNWDNVPPLGGTWTRTHDYWVVKIDSLGNKQWDRRFGGVPEDKLYSLTQTIDGGYLLAGLSDSSPFFPSDITDTSNGYTDYWVVKIDSAGNKLWDKFFGGASYEDEFGNISQTADGGFLVAGLSYSRISGDKSENNLGEEQMWVIKADSLGNKQWDKTIFNLAHDEFGYAIETKEGCYVMANSTYVGVGGYKTQLNWDTTNLTYDYWIVKFCFQNCAVVVIADSVTSSVTCLGTSDGAAKVVAGGGTPPYTYLWSDGQTTSTPTRFPAGTHSVTVTDSLGCVATTSITIAEGPLCTGINENALSHISLYPNPTDRLVILEIPSPEGMESLQLKLYDALGRQVYITPTPVAVGSSKQFSFDIKNLPGNIFFLNITTDSGSRVMKVVKY